MSSKIIKEFDIIIQPEKEQTHQSHLHSFHIQNSIYLLLNKTTTRDEKTLCVLVKHNYIRLYRIKTKIF